jgi:hypothetical protein
MSAIFSAFGVLLGAAIILWKTHNTVTVASQRHHGGATASQHTSHMHHAIRHTMRHGQALRFRSNESLLLTRPNQPLEIIGDGSDGSPARLNTPLFPGKCRSVVPAWPAVQRW